MIRFNGVGLIGGGKGLTAEVEGGGTGGGPGIPFAVLVVGAIDAVLRALLRCGFTHCRIVVAELVVGEYQVGKDSSMQRPR